MPSQQPPGFVTWLETCLSAVASVPAAKRWEGLSAADKTGLSQTNSSPPQPPVPTIPQGRGCVSAHCPLGRLGALFNTDLWVYFLSSC